MELLPYIRLNVSEYLAETAHLTAQEHGAYLMLILNYWQRGESFKANNRQSLRKRLASIARMTSEEWESAEESISEFFETTETEWLHLGIEREIADFRFRTENPIRPSPEVWKKLKRRVFERDDFTCVYCGVRGARLECDHIIPVSRGGDHELSNLATSCFKCNRSKAAKTVDEWRGACHG